MIQRGPERFDRAIVNHLTTTETDALVAAPAAAPEPDAATTPAPIICCEYCQTMS